MQTEIRQHRGLRGMAPPTTVGVDPLGAVVGFVVTGAFFIIGGFLAFIDSTAADLAPLSSWIVPAAALTVLFNLVIAADPRAARGTRVLAVGTTLLAAWLLKVAVPLL